MTITWTLRRNTDQALPASHTIEIMFNVPPDFPGGGVANVPGVLMKESEQARGTPLAGLAVKVTNGFFLIGLSAVDADLQRNIQLLKEQTLVRHPDRLQQWRPRHSGAGERPARRPRFRRCLRRLGQLNSGHYARRRLTPFEFGVVSEDTCEDGCVRRQEAECGCKSPHRLGAADAGDGIRRACRADRRDVGRARRAVRRRRRDHSGSARPRHRYRHGQIRPCRAQDRGDARLDRHAGFLRPRRGCEPRRPRHDHVGRRDAGFVLVGRDRGTERSDHLLAPLPHRADRDHRERRKHARRGRRHRLDAAVSERSLPAQSGADDVVA